MKFLVWLMFLVAPIAWADSIDYQAAGTLPNNTAFVRGSISSGHTWEVGDELLAIANLTTGQTQTGNLGMVDVTTGRLSRCGSGFCFNGGSLDIDNRSGTDLFWGKILSGSISIQNGVTILNAHLANGATSVIRDHQNAFSSQALIHTRPAVVPESATLALMGTGLVGVGWRKWRFRNGNS